MVIEICCMLLFVRDFESMAIKVQNSVKCILLNRRVLWPVTVCDRGGVKFGKNVTIFFEWPPLIILNFTKERAVTSLYIM